MPLRGEKHSDLVRDEAPYFKSLPELDTWFTQLHDKLPGVVPYRPRPHVDGQESDSGAKLLVGQIPYQVARSLTHRLGLSRLQS